MANSIDIKIVGFDQLKKRISSMEQKLADDVNDILNVNVEDIVLHAKQLAPTDEGNLAQSISADKSKPFEKTIVANAPYAAFVEFGIGKLGAQYIAGLPESWQTFAASFRGQKGGTFDEYLLAMTEWVHRHNLHGETALGGTFSRKTHKRTGSKKAQAEQDRQIAWAIIRKRAREGGRAQPFLYPAFRDQEDIIVKDIQELINGF